MRPLADQTVLITGSTDGLGRAVAVALAHGGARLLLHGRDPERLRDTEAEIRDRTGNAELRTYVADFSALDEVGELAEQVARDHDRLDALVNNAGIGTNLPGDGARLESRDGYELRFAVNYLAHFLLTRSLLPLIVSSAPARIVNVSSAGQAPIDFDDVMLERDYSGIQAYCQSKLAQVMFTFDLGDELDAGVRPASSLEEGVAATLRLVADADLDGATGRYFDRRRESRAHPQAYDPAARRQLRELSEQLVRQPARRR